MARPTRPSLAPRRARSGPLILAAVSVALAPLLVPPLLRPEPAGAVCGPVPASAAAVSPAAAASAAAAWLAGQQQADGGFEVAGYPGFETPDAVLAIAEAAQTSGTWSTARAIDAIRGLATCGTSPLTWLDDYSRSGLDAGSAAKLIVLVAAPLGLPADAFDPAADGDAVDLGAILASGDEGDGWFGTFNDTLYAALALRLVDGAVPAATDAAIRAAQHPDGGWDYTGDLSTDTPEDISTTAAGLLALVAGGARPADPAIVRALGFLAARQQPDGGWREDGDTVTNPNATALASLAIRAAGHDPDAGAWRPALPAGTPASVAVTGTPTGALLAAQAPDGHLVGPYDEYGLNTFGTAQGVHGLLRSWLVGALPLTDADPPATTSSVPPTTASNAPARLANSGPTAAGDAALAGLIALALGGGLLALRRRGA